MKRLLRKLGIRLYPCRIGALWLTEAGREIGFYGIHIGRFGVSFTWRIK